jgi:hypothetical protein
MAMLAYHFSLRSEQLLNSHLCSSPCSLKDLSETALRITTNSKLTKQIQKNGRRTWPILSPTSSSPASSSQGSRGASTIELLGEIAPDIRSAPRVNLPIVLAGTAATEAATEPAITEPAGVTGLELPGEVLSADPGKPGKEALLVLGAITAAGSGSGSRRIVGIAAGSAPVVDRRKITGEEVR